MPCQCLILFSSPLKLLCLRVLLRARFRLLLLSVLTGLFYSSRGCLFLLLLFSSSRVLLLQVCLNPQSFVCRSLLLLLFLESLWFLFCLGMPNSKLCLSKCPSFLFAGI